MDELDGVLTTIGRRITELGCGAEPRIQYLADAAWRIAPVAAAVLRSDDEPEIARLRAYLHVAVATTRLTSGERRAWAESLDRDRLVARAA